MKTSSIARWAAALAVCLSGSAATAQITNGLVVHLPFDNDLNNTVPNGISGSPVVSPAFGPGKIGSCVGLTTLKDGSSFNFVTLGYPDALQFGSVRDGTAV